MQNTELRPLGAGEILDRAVTLFVRRFVPIVVVLAAAIAPLMVAEAVIAPGSARMLTDLGRVIASSGNASASNSAVAALSRDGIGAGQYVLILGLSLVVRLLLWSAILAVAAAAYAGATTSFGAAYRIGVRCWPAQLIVGIAFTIIVSVAFVPLLVAYMIALAGTLGLVALHAEIIAAMFGIVAGLVLLAAFAMVGAWVYMTYQLASVAVVTESMSPISAITAALRRTCTRQTWWRTVVAGLIVLAVTQGAGLVLATLGIVIASLSHVASMSYAILGAGSILVEGLVATFVIVYATDVRVRREGLDLMAMSGPETA